MTIDRYDESNVDSRAVALTNKIDSINTLVGVSFSHPAGMIRLESNDNFTHFTTNVNGVQHVYKITSLKYENSSVVDYFYELDYLKDYFLHNSWNDLTGAVVIRSSNISDWSKYLSDSNVLVNGDTETTATQLNSPFNPLNLKFIMILKSPYDINNNIQPYRGYLLDSTELSAISYQLSALDGDKASADAQLLFKQIDKIYIIPETPTTISTTYESIKIYDPDGSSSSSAAVFKELGVSGRLINNLYDMQRIAKTISSIEIHNFIDIQYTQYKLSIPYIGTVDIPAEMLREDDTLDISINYYINLIDGSICYTWNKYSNMPKSNFVELPTISIPSGSEAFESYSMKQSYISSQLTAMLTLAAGAVATVATGGTAATIGTALGGLGLVKNAINNDTQSRLLKAKGVDITSGGGGWYGYIDHYFRLLKSKPKTDIQVLLYKGHPCNKLTAQITAGNYRYWLDASALVLRGLDWYINRVRAEIGSDYILYNKEV